jgi:hypothetical protein
MGSTIVEHTLNTRGHEHKARGHSQAPRKLGVTQARGLPLNLWLTNVSKKRSIFADGGVAHGVRGLATNVTRL